MTSERQGVGLTIVSFMILVSLVFYFGAEINSGWVIELTQSILTDSNSVQSNPDAYLVTRVIDGDTIELATGEKVRYIGIDTPETVKPGTEVECYGREASAFNRQLVEGKMVTLEKDVSETDRNGRLLRYVYVDTVMVNEQLVSEGYAVASAYPPDVRYQERFDELELQAVNEKRGLWSLCNTDRQ